MRPFHYQNGMYALAFVSLAMMSMPVYAHGDGIFLIFIGLPLAVLFYLISATITRNLFANLHSVWYWVIAVALMIPWLALYLFLSVMLIDRLGFEEIVCGTVLAILPLVVARAARKRARKPGSDPEVSPQTTK